MSYTIVFGERILTCEAGENLRAVMLRAGVTPHNGGSTWWNCGGLGSCGTCAVEVHGRVSAKNQLEIWRTEMFPPHKKEHGLRLACQVQIEGDIRVVKHPGFWGHKKDT